MTTHTLLINVHVTFVELDRTWNVIVEFAAMFIWFGFVGYVYHKLEATGAQGRSLLDPVVFNLTLTRPVSTIKPPWSLQYNCQSMYTFCIEVAPTCPRTIAD